MAETKRLKLLVATHNPGKVREYRELLASLPVELTWPGELGLKVEVEENGETFAENAVRKALAYAQASGLWTLADDSGLEVDALGGAPGVRSARYAGPGATDEDRYHLLLRRMEEVPEGRRQARFRCVIALANPQGQVWTAEGTVEGVIIREPRGSGGFGYDPVFYMPEVGCTMAELRADQKNRISHRARAAEAIRPILARLAAQELTGRQDTA
ncbi:MAG: XTP/dITP diphosphatase [Anaerolineae bacterium]